jgi:Ca-activated chloride channel family protein
VAIWVNALAEDSLLNFAADHHLLWLWLLPVIGAVYVWGYRLRKARLEILGMPTSSFWGRGLVKLVAVLLVTLCLVLAMARPRWGYHWREVKTQGVDIVVALDVSKSMMAADVPPNRLERAKRELIDLLGMLRGDRVGLVAFAGVGFMQCPLTVDYAAVRSFLGFLQPDLIPVGGTNIGDAIRVGLEGLKRGGSASSQAIILITDGEDLGGEGLKAAAEAKARGVRVYTIAIGSDEGAPIPEPGGGYKKDDSGQVIISKADTASLEQIAAATGGEFVKAVSGDMDLQRIYQQGIKTSLDDQEISESRQRIWYERFQWFLAAAIVLLVVNWFLPEQRAAVAALALLFGLGFGGRTATAGDAEQGLEKYRAKDYSGAEDAFRSAEIDDPDDPRHVYNRAVTQYRLKNYKDAIQGFDKAAAESSTASPQLKDQAKFNKGNAQVGAGDLKGAAETFRNLLSENPKNDRAKANLEWVERELQKPTPPPQQQQDQQKDQQQQQQQEQQQNDQQQQDQQKQDQQQSDQQQQQDQQQGDQQDQQNQQDQQSQGGGAKPEKQELEDEKQQNQAGQQPQENEQQSQQPQPGQGEQQENQQGQQQPNEIPQMDNPQPPPPEVGDIAEKDGMSTEEADRILRGVQDVMPRPPMQAQPKSLPGKDW